MNVEDESTIARKLLGADQDDNQLEMFPERNPARELLLSIWEHREEINRMNELMEKVLAGEPGYAAGRKNPKRNF